ncbi:MurR/RpiR family transcriptional regulator [Streptomyces niveus]|uniref:MurR/RpiR family transcriptional regulator n=1 Tax=Streptomyces niveus TaxID=193462 RepID=UPI003721E052
MTSDVLTLLHQRLSDLTPTEQRLAQHVMSDPASVVDSSITQLADACHTSAATVARFARSLGFRGYPEFRLAVATNVQRNARARERFQISESDVTPEDDARTTISKIAYTEAATIEQTARDLDTEQLERAVSVITKARRVDIYGIASSGLAGADLQQKLHRAGLFAQTFTDQHLALTSAALLGEQDVAVAFSHSGRTLETVEAVRVASHTGASTIAVTNNAGSPLARSSDLVLTTAAKESTFRSGAMSSRIAQLAIIDFLFVRIVQRDYDRISESLQRTYEAVTSHRVN